MPDTMPKIPTIIKYPKFWILTAVAETSYLFKRCNVVIKRGEILPIKEGMQNINAINLVWISKTRNKVTDKIDTKDNIENTLNIIARLLFMHFEIIAVIVPAKAEITAIKDKIKAALLTPI